VALEAEHRKRLEEWGGRSVDQEGDTLLARGSLGREQEMDADGGETLDTARIENEVTTIGCARKEVASRLDGTLVEDRRQGYRWRKDRFGHGHGDVLLTSSA
jgi:hypothetical protein